MSSTNNLKLGLAQMTSVDDVSVNLGSIKNLYLQLALGGAEIAVFPENSLFFRIQGPLQAVKLSGPELGQLQAVVEREGVPLMLTTAVHESGDKYSNATVLLQKGASPQVLYRKVHLFDVEVEGAPSVTESAHFDPGTGPAVYELHGWRFGLTICYDLRFSELFLKYAQNVDVILVPSSFLVPTGQAHWHVLLRARAIEAQAFVAAPAQVGEHCSVTSGVRHTYGHTLAIDPWGKVLEDFEKSWAQARIVNLDRSLIEKVRRQIPMANHRRL